MSASLNELPGPRAVPSVPVQVARAAAGTFSVLLVVALVGGLVASWDRVSLLWYRVAGDPSIRLADGVVLSDQEADVVVPETVSSAWARAQDVARIAAVTGPPVRAVTAAQAKALTGISYSYPGDTTELRLYSSPIGLVRVTDYGPGNPDLPAQVDVRPMTADPWTGDIEAQTALMKRLTTGWTAGAAPAAPGTRVVVKEEVLPDGPRGILGAQLATSDASTSFGSLGIGFFSPSTGRLTDVRVNLVRPSATRTLHVISPAASFAAVRRHGEGTTSEQQTVASAHLVVGDFSGGAGDLAYWSFVGTNGQDLNAGPALP